jgi:hypothetical protein
MSFSDDLYGRLDADSKLTKGLLRCAVRRAQRLADAGMAPTGRREQVYGHT